MQGGLKIVTLNYYNSTAKWQLHIIFEYLGSKSSIDSLRAMAGEIFPWKMFWLVHSAVQVDTVPNYPCDSAQLTCQIWDNQLSLPWDCQENIEHKTVHFN